MPHLILNSFPVEVSPTELSLPHVDYPSWEASTEDLQQRYAAYRIHRFAVSNPGHCLSPAQQKIRLILLSGPQPPNNDALITCNTAVLPDLTNKLIENSLAQHLSRRGMKIKHERVETLALRYHQDSPNAPVSFYTGLSFRSRRPHVDEPFRFALIVQWRAGARFSQSLEDKTLRSISSGMPVIYTPQTEPDNELSPFANRFIGIVDNTADQSNALISCKDDVQRTIPFHDLTLEPSPKVLRRYELCVGSDHYRNHVRKRVDQLKKVLTENNRRNNSVLSDRLKAIIQTLSGTARDQLVLPLCSFVRGTVRIRLSPQQVRFDP